MHDWMVMTLLHLFDVFLAGFCARHFLKEVQLYIFILFFFTGFHFQSGILGAYHTKGTNFSCHCTLGWLEHFLTRNISHLHSLFNNNPFFLGILRTLLAALIWCWYSRFPSAWLSHFQNVLLLCTIFLSIVHAIYKPMFMDEIWWVFFIPLFLEECKCNCAINIIEFYFKINEWRKLLQKSVIFDSSGTMIHLHSGRWCSIL